MAERGEKRPDKSFPLVIYKGGQRIVIGQAILKGDGQILGQIAKDIRQELKEDLFGDRVGDISINPTLTAPVDLKYNVISTPPKIQE